MSEERTQIDALMAFGRKPPAKAKWEQAQNGKLPSGIYQHEVGKYIVREQLSSGLSIVRLWDSSVDQLSSLDENRLKFLVAKSEHLCWKPAESGKSFPAKIVFVDAKSNPNIYVGRNASLEVGLVAKLGVSDCYAFYRTSKLGIDSGANAQNSFQVLCTL